MSDKEQNKSKAQDSEIMKTNSSTNRANQRENGHVFALTNQKFKGVTPEIGVMLCIPAKTNISR